MKLIAVTNNCQSVEDLTSTIISIENAVDYIHIRETAKTAAELISLFNKLEISGVEKEKLVLHDRLDLAWQSNLSSIHLPSHGLPIQWVRGKFPNMRIGRSVHSTAEAVQAEKEGADYLLYGHCFETDSKKGTKPNGITQLDQIKTLVSTPVFAIGGISVNRLTEMRQTKADGIAAMSGIFSATSPLAAAKSYAKGVKQN